MKTKILILLGLLALNCITSQSVACVPDDTEETELYVDLDFSVSINPIKGHTSSPKSPMIMPRVQQVGHTLYTISGCNESTLVVLDEFGNELFSTYITENTSLVNIPYTISGSCEVQIRRGAYCFYAPIEL